MQTLILSIHIFLAIALIVLILVQHGKGADAGAAFGSGASSTVFGAQGSASFLTKITTAAKHSGNEKAIRFPLKSPTFTEL